MNREKIKIDVNKVREAVVAARAELRLLAVRPSEELVAAQFDLILARLEAGIAPGVDALANLLAAARRLPPAEGR